MESHLISWEQLEGDELLKEKVENPFHMLNRVKAHREKSLISNSMKGIVNVTFRFSYVCARLLPCQIKGNSCKCEHTSHVCVEEPLLSRPTFLLTVRETFPYQRTLLFCVWSSSFRMHEMYTCCFFLKKSKAKKITFSRPGRTGGALSRTTTTVLGVM